MQSLTIKKEIIDNVLCIAFIGEIGLSEEYKFRQEINSFLSDNPKKIILDLSEIVLLSSYGIAGLVNLWKKVNDIKGVIVIICPKNHVYDSLTIAGTDKLIPIFQEQDQAINFINQKV